MELFNYKGALEINYARIQHLDTLQETFTQYVRTCNIK